MGEPAGTEPAAQEHKRTVVDGHEHHAAPGSLERPHRLGNVQTDASAPTRLEEPRPEVSGATGELHSYAFEQQARAEPPAWAEEQFWASMEGEQP